MLASALTASTNSSAGCFTLSSAARSAATSLVTPGRGFVLTNEHRFDRMRRIGRQERQVAIDGRTLPPRNIQDLHIEAQSGAHVRPQMAELAETRNQHLVTRTRGNW